MKGRFSILTKLYPKDLSQIQDAIIVWMINFIHFVVVSMFLSSNEEHFNHDHIKKKALKGVWWFRSLIQPVNGSFFLRSLLLAATRIVRVVIGIRLIRFVIRARLACAVVRIHRIRSLVVWRMALSYAFTSSNYTHRIEEDPNTSRTTLTYDPSHLIPMGFSH